MTSFQGVVKATLPAADVVRVDFFEVIYSPLRAPPGCGPG